MKILGRLLFLTFCLCFTGRAWAGPQEQAEELFAKALAVNPGLKDYCADIDVALKARVGFVPYNPLLKGKYYHRRPDRHKLALEKGPSYLKKYPNVFGFQLPNLERFRVLRIQPLELGKLPVHKIMLVPREKAGDIRTVDLFIHRQNFTVPRYDTYYEKGHLLVNVDFEKVDGYWLFRTMQAEFVFPSVQARATATYGNYLFNQGFSDQVFEP